MINESCLGSFEFRGEKLFLLYHNFSVFWQEGEILELIGVIIDMVEFGDFILHERLYVFVAVVDYKAIPRGIVTRVSWRRFDTIGIGLEGFPW